MQPTVQIKLNTDTTNKVELLIKANNILVDRVDVLQGELLMLQSLVSRVQEDVKPFLLSKYKDANTTKKGN